VRDWAAWLRSAPPRRKLSNHIPGAAGPTLLAQTWLVAVRRWLRRYTALSLAALVARPGKVLVTPTHLDLYFTLEQADIRVRQAGLDLDPGWLPWWGRVVQFHYL
jgi:hypothetical protein